MGSIDALLEAESNDSARVLLLLEKLWLEREVLAQSAASTAEALARSGERWAMPLAVAWSAATGAWSVAAKWAEEMIGAGGERERADYAAASARLHLAAGDVPRARELALAALGEDPSDPFAATLAFRLAAQVPAVAAVLDASLADAPQCEMLRQEVAAGGADLALVFEALSSALALESWTISTAALRLGLIVDTWRRRAVH
jgi:hypothetical protein